MILYLISRIFDLNNKENFFHIIKECIRHVANATSRVRGSQRGGGAPGLRSIVPIVRERRVREVQLDRRILPGSAGPQPARTALLLRAKSEAAEDGGQQHRQQESAH